MKTAVDTLARSRWTTTKRSSKGDTFVSGGTSKLFNQCSAYVARKREVANRTPGGGLVLVRVCHRLLC